LAKEFLPGPLTVILKKSKQITSPFISQGETVAIRIPSHPMARAIIKEVGAPLAATSVNRSKEPPLIDGKVILERYDRQVAAIVDDGKSSLQVASTIISLVGKPKIIRLGTISQKKLEESLNLNLTIDSVKCLPKVPF
jgi:L-threonylcarbamoyladenylate synthase